MRISGIIAEYDPFHNGHAYQIKKTREAGAEAVVVAIGGEFTQRGEPAWCSKYLRTEAALLCGADLVLEIPLPFAMGSAERFAKGGIQVLNALGCIDTLSFGSETADAEKIMAFAKLSDSEEFAAELKKQLTSGISAAAARQNAAEALAPELAEICGEPNDILAVEYCKWINRLGSKMKPLAIKRYGAEHGAENTKSGIASASYLRSFSEPEDIFPFVPAETHALLQREFEHGHLPCSAEKLSVAMLAKLRTMQETDFARIPDCHQEGLYNRVMTAVRNTSSYGELLDEIKTKRYAMSRIKRVLCASFVGLDEMKLKSADVPYVRILGMNKTGAAVLKEASEQGMTLPIGSSLAELGRTSPKAEYFAKLEGTGEDLWQLGLPKPGICGLAFRTKMIDLEEAPEENDDEELMKRFM